MALISLTRLRLASPRYLPGFVWYALRSARQARRSAGFLGMRLLPDRHLTFWTATAWTDLAAMKRYRSDGAHRRAMPLLARWCDEASVTRWIGDPATMDDWPAAHARMNAEGEPSAVRHPSPAQLARTYPPPRLGLKIGTRS
jgi:hypothetical protein